MITVYQGFFVLFGAISGNVVMDEVAHLTQTSLAAYSASVLVILLGLCVLVQGERAPAAGRAGLNLT